MTGRYRIFRKRKAIFRKRGKVNKGTVAEAAAERGICDAKTVGGYFE